MYKVDDIVAYSNQGICRIVEICTREVAGKNIDYYILKPIFDERSTVSVPVSNEKLVGRMRTPLDIAGSRSLLDELKTLSCEWIEDDSKRREYFTSILTDGIPSSLAMMFKMLLLRRRELEGLSRKLRSTDENFLRQAERILCYECSYAGCGEPKEIKDILTALCQDQ